MEILTAPLNSMERQAAMAAANAALRNKSHAGIRPAEQTPRKKRPGVHIQNARHIDDAIATARQIWPQTRKFSVFGASSFTRPSAMADMNQSDLEWLAMDNENDSTIADGLFDGAEDFGEFECDPTTNLNIEDSNTDDAPDGEAA
jgi:hypothetical protein